MVAQLLTPTALHPSMIAPLAPVHAPAAARLHIAGQPGTFLTALGPEVLTVLYAQLPRSTVGFGFAAVDDDSADADSADDAGAVSGFVSATTGVGRLFAELGTRRMGQFAPALLRRYAQAPGLILRSAQTVLYPLLARADDVDAHHGAPAELLSIMVEPAQRGQGIGSVLLARLVTECQTRRLPALDVTVDATNAAARRFYARHGFVLRKEFTLYGRAMCLYQRALTTREPDAPPDLRHEDERD